LEKSKSRNISVVDGPMSIKVGMLTCLSPPDLLLKYNFAVLSVRPGPGVCPGLFAPLPRLPIPPSGGGLCDAALS